MALTPDELFKKLQDEVAAFQAAKRQERLEQEALARALREELAEYRKGGFDVE